MIIAKYTVYVSRISTLSLYKERFSQVNQQPLYSYEANERRETSKKYKERWWSHLFDQNWIHLI